MIGGMPLDRDVLLLVGTTKGLFFVDQNGLRGPVETGASVPSVAYDARRGRIFAGVSSFFWGTGVKYSDDLGQTWVAPETPNLQFPADTDAKMTAAWQIMPAGPDQPETLFVGVEPAALFRSDDGGVTFELVRGLWDHPHRPTWQPGGGGLCLHTIVLDPRDPKRLLVAISTGGVYISEDAGSSWRPSNSGVRAQFLPEDQRYPEYGQCVHKVARDASQLDTLYLQNHWGLYRSDNNGESWTDIANGVPTDFGFPIVAHPHTTGTAYIIPLGSEMERWTVEAKCRVYRTSDAGVSWEALTRGLPQDNAHVTVLRDAFCSDKSQPLGLYFGTRGGEVFASFDEGANWEVVAERLPPILCVRAATLS